VGNAGRFVLVLGKYDTVKHLITIDLRWLFSNYMCDYETIKLAFDIYSGQGPPYFQDYLKNDNDNNDLALGKIVNHFNIELSSFG